MIYTGKDEEKRGKTERLLPDFFEPWYHYPVGDIQLALLLLTVKKIRENLRKSSFGESGCSSHDCSDIYFSCFFYNIIIFPCYNMQCNTVMYNCFRIDVWLT